MIYGTPDLDGAAAMLQGRHGLSSLPGGRLRGGMVNRVVPLGPLQYLELLAVEEVGDAWTERIKTVIDAGRTLLNWGILVDDIEAVAARRGCDLQAGSIRYADGSMVSWRTASSDDPSLPFFIAYDNAEQRVIRFEERLREAGNQGFGGFTFVGVGGDPERVGTWLGQTDLPVRFVGGRPGLQEVGIAGPSGEIVLREQESAS